MITTPQEYNEKLWLIQTNNFPRKAILPFAETIYNVDMKTRIIDSPAFLSVAKDHKAETIYFSVPRYVDYMDLAETACIIQYTLPDKDKTTGIYAVPFYDITTFNDYGNERILLPWLLDGKATSVSGVIEYSIRFFIIDDSGQKFLYNLNTIPAKSKILYGMDVIGDATDDSYDIDADAYTTLLNRIADLSKKDIYWIELQ